jgi:mono/diheme cytochrome c family protein
MTSTKLFPAAVLAILGSLVLNACAKKEPGPAAREGASRVPGVTDRTKLPPSGKQGPPGEAASLAGDWKAGEKLFAERCAGCHGSQGTGGVLNPGSDEGLVPALNPVPPHLLGEDPAVFAANLDRFMQHGSLPNGPNPELIMPDWGDSRVLSQKQIADLEAYVMRLNGVER